MGFVGRLPAERRIHNRTVNRLRRDGSFAVLHGSRRPYTHGLRSTYNDGCRCDPCTEAEAAYSHARKTAARQNAATR